MVGIFDSGLGGAFSLFEFHRICPREKVAFFADKANSPYGEKSEEELISLVSADIAHLAKMGAERVLMACCTASAVYDKLPPDCRDIAIPIIAPSAREALSLSRSGRIGVISTKATARSGEFEKQLKRLSGEAQVITVPTPELVTLVESGIFGGRMNSFGMKTLRDALAPLRERGVDTLILGCTHFAYFKSEIENIMEVPAVSCAEVGAAELMRAVEYKKERKLKWQNTEEEESTMP